MGPFRRLLPLVVGLAIVTFPTSAAATSHASGLAATAALDWNVIAVSTVRGATVPLPKFQIEGLIYVSYVQAAVYDAVTTIEGRYIPYHRFKVSPKLNVEHASPEAAIAAATYYTLRHYLSDQPAALLDTLRATYLAKVAALPSRGKKAGIAVGRAAAHDIIELREHDGLNGPFTFTPGAADPGVWQFAPAPSLQFAQTPWVAKMHPFLLKGASQFRTAAPPALTSQAYADAFNEVKAYGAVNSAVRTPAQTASALFWNANAINQYNQAFRDLAIAHGFDLVDTVRLLAMGNMVGSDAGIGCFASKYRYAFWRPITAIRDAAADGNPLTAADPIWSPLLTTPNHPEAPSAHGCVTGAIAQVFVAVLGTKSIGVDIHGSATGAPGDFTAVRHFNTAKDLTDEITNARTWIGFHFRFSTIEGVKLGRRTADWALARFFQPVEDD